MCFRARNKFKNGRINTTKEIKLISGVLRWIRCAFIRLQVARWEPGKQPKHLSMALSPLASGPRQGAEQKRTDSGPAKGGGCKEK